ncbi:MAG: ABC transporter permease [Anaerolineaceae bacterium]|jgi:putative ABC transport system permease protein
MRIADLFSLILDNLGRRKGRVALTAIGVVIGTAAVVTLVSLGAGLQKNATSSLWGISDLSKINVYQGYPDMQTGVIQEFKESDIKKMTLDAIKQIEAIPGVERVIVTDYLQASMDLSYDQFIGYSQIVGVNVDDLKDMGYEVSQGVTTLEKNKIVIGSWVPRNFYLQNAQPGKEPPPPPELFGKVIKANLMKWSNDGVMTKRSYTFEVVGVLKETKGEADGSIYVPLDQMQQWNEWVAGKHINRNKEGYNSLIVRAESPEQTIEISKQINEMGFQAYTPQSTVEGINSFFTIMQVVFGGVGAIALLVAAIGIANTMTMAILERVREIGIMKAIGATNNNVLSIFLGEAAGIGFLGGLGGVGLGWVICSIINVFGGAYLATQASSGGGGMMGGSPIATSMPWWLPVFSVAFATLVGLLSGLYPALNAATLVPVNALKYE